MSSRLVQGYATWTSIDGDIIKESDTFTCCHCNQIVFIKVGASANECGGFCRMCMKAICILCIDKGCTPFEEKLERIELRDRLLRLL